jgi:hypothetical protein
MKLVLVLAVLGCSTNDRPAPPAAIAPAGDDASTVEAERPPAASMIGPSGIVTEPHTFYDSSGAVAGKRDAHGFFYDRTGAYVGRRDSASNFYGSAGTLAGRVDSAQNYYDAAGTYAGRCNDDGSYFDGTGAYAGRIDVSGNLYDRTGVAVGHVDGFCDDACKQDAVARVLVIH